MVLSCRPDLHQGSAQATVFVKDIDGRASVMGNQLKMTLRKSKIGSTKKIRATLTGLGLTRTNKTIVRQDTPEIRGMLRKVTHLVEVEEQ